MKSIVPRRLVQQLRGNPVAVPVRLRSASKAPSTSRPEVQGYHTACAAPSIQLRFDPNGLVTTCCKSLQPLGHVSTDRLIDIWQGTLRNSMVKALESDDFSVGCQRCGAEVVAEGRAASYAAIHDEWSDHLTNDPASQAWPVRMEMNLSNACNLQCIQCDGESSSAIRIHREKRPPLPKVYGDDFFEQLRVFLPHLQRIVFGGGEPFLGPENFKVWDLIAAEAPHIDCMVVTNATQLTPRIEALLERVRFSFVFSIDGITASTYESIRVGSDFEAVMANVDRFCAYAKERGTTVSVNHCLMPQNVHEFGDLLLWAEAKNLFVNVSVVRSPASASITSLSAAELAAVDAELERQEPHVASRLKLNLSTWQAERDRIRSWVQGAHDPRGTTIKSVLWFRCAGSGYHDDRDARAELATWTSPEQVHSFTVGADDRIIEAKASFLDDPAALTGGSVQDLTNAVVAQFGNMDHYEVMSTSDDRVDAKAQFGDTKVRITTVALRDQNGWADRARLLLAVG